MPVKEKTKVLPWLVAGLALLVLLAVIILVLGGISAEHPVETAPPATTEAETTGPTVPANTLTPMDFAYVGDYLTCTTRPSVMGIDVSFVQQEIDWQQVKAAGVEFAIIRLAYRGSIQGLLSTDDWAQINYEGAKAAGIKVGGYIFTQSISPEEGVEDAEYVMNIVKDWDLDFPLVYDWEIIDPSYRNGNLSPRVLTDTMLAFCETVEKAGYDAMVYFNLGQEKRNFYLEELQDYGFWLADYSGVMDCPYWVDMWQYTCEGRVPGIDGNVDINLYFPPEE